MGVRAAQNRCIDRRLKRNVPSKSRIQTPAATGLYCRRTYASQLMRDRKMTTTIETNKSPHLLMWAAGIAVIVFSGTGIAAIMGWIPTSMGHTADTTELATPAKPAVAKNTGSTQ